MKKLVYFDVPGLREVFTITVKRGKPMDNSIIKFLELIMGVPVRRIGFWEYNRLFLRYQSGREED